MRAPTHLLCWTLIAVVPLGASSGAGIAWAALPPAAPAGAAPWTLEGWQASALGALDVRIEGGGAGRVTVSVDRTRLRAALPGLREHGVVPQEFTAEVAERRPMLAINLLSLLLTSWAVRDAYAAEPSLAATRWTVLLSPPSAGGGQASAQEMFSFAMDRPRYEHVAWDTLVPAAFPRATSGFGYNPRFAYEVSREAGGIDDD